MSCGFPPSADTRNSRWFLKRDGCPTNAICLLSGDQVGCDSLPAYSILRGSQAELASQAEALHSLGRLDDAYATARRALKAATQRRLGRQRGSLLNTLGLIFCRAGEWRKGHYLLKRGLAAAVAADDERLAAKLRNNLGNLYWKRGEWQRAQAQYEANLAAAQRLRDPWTELTALHNLGVLHCDGHSAP